MVILSFAASMRMSSPLKERTMSAKISMDLSMSSLLMGVIFGSNLQGTVQLPMRVNRFC